MRGALALEPDLKCYDIVTFSSMFRKMRHIEIEEWNNSFQLTNVTAHGLKLSYGSQTTIHGVLQRSLNIHSLPSSIIGKHNSQMVAAMPENGLENRR